MNPHHPGHSAAYPHHPSLSSSPHHSGPHHGYSTGGGGGGGGGGGTTTTPDLPSPHSPPHGPAIDPATPYASMQPGQGMGSNGHHHSGAGMMSDHPHHPGHPHPHLPGHTAYPPVNHNNNCTLKVRIRFFFPAILVTRHASRTVLLVRLRCTFYAGWSREDGHEKKVFKRKRPKRVHVAHCSRNNQCRSFIT